MGLNTLQNPKPIGSFMICIRSKSKCKFQIGRYIYEYLIEDDNFNAQRLEEKTVRFHMDSDCKMQSDTLMISKLTAHWLFNNEKL